MPEPLLVPLCEPDALGAVLLPEELPVEPGPQSFIADFASAWLLLLPSVLDVPLLPVLEPRLLLLDAELFGPQPGFAMEPVVPGIELVPDFAPAPVLIPALPPLPLPPVCAMAAPPSVNARTETAVRRRRFIGVPPYC
jgi:hypothetical protein